MRAIAIFEAMLLIGPLAASTAGCGSQAAAVCDLVCECEHCNDYEEDLTCIQLEGQADVAEAYECADQWDAWATCVEEKGECDADEARFSTSGGSGSCSGSEPTGDACTTDTDCGGNESCQGGMCARRVCAGDGSSCQSDADCPGQDRCASERDALSGCIDDSSAHDGPILGDFD